MMTESVSERAYYQALGRPDGIGDSWEEGGITWGLRLERRKKKDWILSVAARKGKAGHTVTSHFNHRPTCTDAAIAFADGRKTLMDYLEGRNRKEA